MAKINITKPTGGVEALTLLSAFKGEGNTYVIFDSEKTGSMGLPIIYVSKYTNKLEKIDDQNEWQSVKNYLKGIINGTNFEYVKIPEQIPANEAYYMQLSLPNQTSFDVIKNRYIPTATSDAGPLTPPVETLESPTPAPAINLGPTPVPSVAPAPASINNENPTTSQTPNLESITPKETPPEVSAPTEKAPEVSPASPTPVPVVSETPSNVAPTTPIIPATPVEQPQTTPAPAASPTNSNFDFSSDKATFLKACENMFDALISKYQKELNALNEREKNLQARESEISLKMANADEHLKNAEAKEQVANIAHDNASKIMDISKLMPESPNQTN